MVTQWGMVVDGNWLRAELVGRVLNLVPKLISSAPGCARKSGSGWAVEICGRISGYWYTPKWAGASGTRHFLI